MADLKKLPQEYPCTDCSVAFLDYKQYFLHRKYHTSLFRNVITEECLLEESCPLCSIKYFKKYKNACLEDLLGSGRTLGESEGGTKSKQAMRCKYYPKCKLEFEGHCGFTRHVKRVHNDDRPYACQQCNYTASRYGHLKHHLFSHAGYKRFKCHLCPKECTTKTSLNGHLLSSHKEVNIKSHDCSYCDKKFSTSTRLKFHLRIHVPSKTFKCHICAKKFSHKRNLKHHLEMHNNSREDFNGFTCDICSKRFAYKASLKRHNLTHIRKKPFSSDFCGNKSNTYTHDEYYQNTILDKQPYECKECGDQFAWETSLKKHLDPDKESKKTLRCKKCPKTFKNLNCFAYHERSHSEYLCEICNKKCFTLHGIKRHLKSHGIKLENDSCSKTLHSKESSRLKNPIKCSLCPKEYRSKDGLRRHLLKHQGKEPYACKRCGKKFMREKFLKAHVNPEKETKHPLPCKECSETFNNINCLLHHKRSHGEEFLCEVCNVKCFTRFGFKGHLAKHGIILDPT